ncbi:hypothetical protein BGZ76_005252, partial [Entomortierella beljakovae]
MDRTIQTQLEWALAIASSQSGSNLETNNEHVRMPTFASRFRYSNEKSAEDDFLKLIQHPRIPAARRKTLMDQYTAFKKNDARLFWDAKRTRLGLKSVAKKAAVVTAEAGLKEMQKEYMGCSNINAVVDDPSLQADGDNNNEQIRSAEHSGQTTPNFNNILQSSKRKLNRNDSDLDDNQSTITSSQEPPQKKVAFLDIDFPSESESEYAPSSARSSLNSIDLRYINHLVGPGTTSSQLKTSARMIVGDVDVSLALMDARRKIVAHQSEINNNSDLLCLNFIFDAEFMMKNLTSEVISKLPHIKVPDASDEEILLLSKCSIFAAKHSFLETKRHFRDIAGHSMISEVLKAYAMRPGLWQSDSHHSLENEDTYTESVVKNIIIGVFGDLDAADHCISCPADVPTSQFTSRDPLPTPKGFEEKYLPDYFSEKDGLPFLIAEIKKPGLDGDILEGDQRKLPGMMKIMLDALLTAGVQKPAIIGLLVCGSQCEIFLMTVEYEAIYSYKCVGVFGLPRNNHQLGLLLAALGPLAAAH